MVMPTHARGGGPGTNQYQIKGTAKTNAPVPSLDPLLQSGDSETAAVARYALELVERFQGCGMVQNPIRMMLDIPDCPASVLRQLTVGAPRNKQPSGPNVAKALEHPNCPSDVVEYARQRRSASFDIKMALLRREGASVAEWRKVAKNKTRSAQVQVALLPGCPPEVKQDVWAALRANKTQPYGSTVAAQTIEIYARMVVFTPEIHDQAYEMWQHPLRYVGTALASNPTCPSDVLVGMVTGDDIGLRRLALANPNCPEHIRTIAVLAR